jgi:hypothetical protein
VEVQERKKEEKQQKKEELKLLKSLKKREILDKLDKLKKITGNEEMALNDEDIDGDFDPAAYDRYYYCRYFIGTGPHLSWKIDDNTMLFLNIKHAPQA